MAYKGSGKKAKIRRSGLKRSSFAQDVSKAITGKGDGFARRDTGGKSAKRQTQKNHGTNRKGGYKKG